MLKKLKAEIHMDAFPPFTMQLEIVSIFVVSAATDADYFHAVRWTKISTKERITFQNNIFCLSFLLGDAPATRPAELLSRTSGCF